MFGTLFTKIGSLLISLGLVIQGWFGGGIGGFTPVGGQVYYLSGAGISTTATSITLKSFKVPVADIDLSMDDFGDVGYATLEPTNPSKREFISFTGITQSDTDDKATLTGVTRGLNFISPYTASTTLRQSHSGGSSLILSDPPQLYAKYGALDDEETVTAKWSWSVLPESTVDATTTYQFVNKNYADNVAVQGAATSTETQAGICELSTYTENASSTDKGAADPLCIQPKHATSTPTYSCDASGTTGAMCLLVAENDGNLNQEWYDLTESWTFTGGITLNTATSTANATTTFTPMVGISTTTPTALDSGLVVDDDVYFGSGVGIGVATTSDNTLEVAGHASTTLLHISEDCVGCIKYMASSTTFACSSGTVTYTGSIPSNAKWGFIHWYIGSFYGSNVIAREGITSSWASYQDDDGDATLANYQFTWSGNNFAVVEQSDDSSDIAGTVYWYR